MAKESVFDKEWVDERDKDNFEGLLEQLNVPPKVITFIRENKRLMQVLTALLLVTIVTWALYDSYRDKKIENASSALSAAVAFEGDELVAALGTVADEFSGTTSAAWAEVNIAHELMRSGKTQEANAKYIALRSEIKKSSSLQPLLILGIAQTSEILANYPDAEEQYDTLRSAEGYQDIGFSGLARIYEIQGEKEKALQVYEEHLSLLNSSAAPGQKALVEEKIARIKAVK